MMVSRIATVELVCPTARIVNVVGANLYMFLSNEADVLREVRAFAAELTAR